ncbi:AAA domain protein [uncultured archaeon]|nr:AAA domain protein [uncultured archaeon]
MLDRNISMSIETILLQKIKDGNKEDSKITRIFLEKLSQERQENSKVIAAMNNKGGVGKTSLSAAYGLTMARKNKNVLFWDNDGQSNLSQRLGIPDTKLPDRRISTVYALAPIAGTMETIIQIPFVLDYPRFMRYRGTKGKPGVIALMGGSHDVEIDAKGASEKINKNSLEYKNVYDFTRKLINFYRQYFDYIIMDTAPALEGNILNQISARVADTIITPVDGLEAALGINQLMGWIHGETSPEISGRQTPPDILFAMVKYIQPLASKEEAAETIVTDIRYRNDIYRTMKEVFGDYTCDAGVKAATKIMQSKLMFRKTDYDAVVNELQQKIEDKSRPNIFTIWTNEKKQELVDKLDIIAKKNIKRKVEIRQPKYIM